MAGEVAKEDWEWFFSLFVCTEDGKLEIKRGLCSSLSFFTTVTFQGYLNSKPTFFLQNPLYWNVFCQFCLTRWNANTDNCERSAAVSDFVKINSKAGKSRLFTKRVA